MRNIDLIILHHSATEPKAYEGDLDGQAMVDIICSNHHRNWSKNYPNYKCDYHFLIGATGKVFEGQPLEKAGWHSGNYQVNLESIGICFLGNFEKILMPEKQMLAGAELIKNLRERFNIKEIKKHSDIVPTLCPGKHFPFDKMLKESQIINTTGFSTLNTDVDISNEDIVEYDKAIKFVLDNKIMCPFPDTPAYVDNYMEEPVTKGELAVFLLRLKKLLNKEIEVTGFGGTKNYTL